MHQISARLGVQIPPSGLLEFNYMNAQEKFDWDRYYRIYLKEYSGEVCLLHQTNYITLEPTKFYLIKALSVYHRLTHHPPFRFIDFINHLEKSLELPNT